MSYTRLPVSDQIKTSKRKGVAIALDAGRLRLTTYGARAATSLITTSNRARPIHLYYVTLSQSLYIANPTRHPAPQ